MNPWRRDSAGKPARLSGGSVETPEKIGPHRNVQKSMKSF